MEKKPISKALRTFFGVGDMGFSLMASVEMYFFVFFMTNVAKFPLATVALIGSVTSIGDALLSPFYGAIIDGTKPMKWGKYRSWMLICPPIVVILYMFQFTKIGGDGLGAIIVTLGFILSHIAWNIPWVANIALIPMLSSTPADRGLLSSRRATWSAMAGIIFSYTGANLAALYGRVTGNEVLGYTLLAGTFAFVMMIGYWAHFKMTDGYEETGAQAAASQQNKPRLGLIQMLKMAATNHYLIVLLFGDLMRYMANFIMTAAAAYYFTYVAKNPALFATYLLLASLARLVGSYIAAPVTKKFSSRRASIAALILGGGFLVVAKLVGYNVLLFFVAVMAAGIFLGILQASMVALYSDVSVYSEWQSGQPATAWIMGLMTLSLKIAVISRGTVIPFVLATAGFVATADPATASKALTDGVINVFVLIPAIFMLLSAAILGFGYRLTNEKLEGFEKEIAERKSAAASQ
ncbi:MFS transporter [Alkalibacter rhizosphaerae]|uniref:MFS transporter n=1 Tax=Alkalibacter rhizosphaerae TaxID=2815577 RepID=A0A975AHZ0_9FIRM|nr:MFS transporter [Alkalibacter rhizosphaerae]QSX08528.1 MFS transporter [Alkalibacter rhizosphaerae]